MGRALLMHRGLNRGRVCSASE